MPALESVYRCVKALQKLDALVKDGVVRAIGFEDELKAHVVPALEAQLMDLRSSIVKEACKALASLAAAIGRAFDTSAAALLPVLFTRLYVSIKVISSSGETCARALVTSAGSARLMPVLSAAMDDSHAVVRAKACNLTEMLLEHLADNGLSREVEAAIIAQAARAVEDSDGPTRAAGRQLSLALELCAPAAFQRLLTHLPAAVTKALDKDRLKTSKRVAPSTGFAEVRKKFKLHVDNAAEARVQCPLEDGFDAIM
jgi:hypothetical protein